MRNFIRACAVAGVVFAGTAVHAQTNQVYIQIEAQPSLNAAETAVRGYAARLDRVNGFSLGQGWYGIALGPFAPEEAATELRLLRRSGLIPRDSYLAAADEYGQQFWPVGAQAGTAPEAQSDQTAAAEATTPEPQTPEPQVIDETPREARASEALLTGEERKQLQIALQWAGVYNAGIDGAFGRGTRSAMGEWQSRNGYDVTGVLTTMQRADLLGQYNAILEGMDVQTVADSRAGIEIDLPMGAVGFDKYEAPFAIYDATGTVPEAKVLLISQPGDRDTLNGLYEILQTLEIVPLNGPRDRQRNGFALTGENSRIVSHTEARLQDGHIKGWMLVWPAGDEERRTRLLGTMKASFRTTDAVLDPARVTDQGQAIDLVSGMQIRQPKGVAAGFFVGSDGAVLTSSDAVASCGRITLDDAYDASVVSTDAMLGVAVLRPEQRLAPRDVASFRADPPRLKSEVAVAGYPYGGVLSAPTLTFGSLEDIKGLGGEAGQTRLAMNTQPGDAGGPVLDAGGAVLGMLLPAAVDGRQLPADVALAADAEALMAFLNGAGVTGQTAGLEGVLAPEDLTAKAMDLTVKVSCWE